ncbi:uncharacterized protein LOC106665037 [Cimex lectularius]|uniref:Uncharacterized protein n=1 Tax=Cimex lectularius TaxID=79782 RepID=A0A8I6RN33_CIMLE|nr:uncharacterized protein LOC106665037 [Cimex lectularius]
MESAKRHTLEKIVLPFWQIVCSVMSLALATFTAVCLAFIALALDKSRPGAALTEEDLYPLGPMNHHQSGKETGFAALMTTPQKANGDCTLSDTELAAESEMENMNENILAT